MTRSTLAAILIPPVGTISLLAWLALVFYAGRDHPPRAGRNPAPGRQSPGTADTLDSLALAFAGLGDHEQAIAHYQQAASIFQEIGDPRGEASTLTRLGDMQAAVGQRDDARRSWERALTLIMRMPGGDSAPVRQRRRLASPGPGTTIADATPAGTVAAQIGGGNHAPGTPGAVPECTVVQGVSADRLSRRRVR